MPSAAKRVPPPYAVPAPAAGGPTPVRSETTVAVPAGGEIRARVDLLAFRGAEVVVENLGHEAAEVTHPDGRIPADNVTGSLEARTRLRLCSVPDAWDELTLVVRSARGTTVRISATGEPVPLVPGEVTIPQRDPVTGLLTRVLRRPGWVPGPASPGR